MHGRPVAGAAARLLPGTGGAQPRARLGPDRLSSSAWDRRSGGSRWWPRRGLRAFPREQRPCAGTLPAPIGAALGGAASCLPTRRRPARLLPRRLRVNPDSALRSPHGLCDPCRRLPPARGDLPHGRSCSWRGTDLLLQRHRVHGDGTARRFSIRNPACEHQPHVSIAATKPHVRQLN